MCICARQSTLVCFHCTAFVYVRLGFSQMMGVFPSKDASFVGVDGFGIQGLGFSSAASQTSFVDLDPPDFWSSRSDTSGMEMDEKNNTDLEKNQPSGHNQHLSFHGPGFSPTSPEAQIASSTDASTASMGNQFPPGLWNPHPPGQSLGLGETNANAMIAGHPFSSFLGMLSAGVSPFAATSGSVDRGTGFPCLNGSNLGAMINHPFPSTQPLGSFQNGIEPYREVETTVGGGCSDASLTGDGQRGDAKMSHGFFAPDNELSKPESSGGVGQDEGPSVSCTKKRKRPGQDRGVMHVQEGSQQLSTVAAKQENDNDEKGELKRSVTASRKSNGKQTESNTDAPKEEYIHVRARSGQATNSHSLAERVRREKISERMKFLQDLVPGCSKVIGKAVMLDEIINYVQSLQRQVEFLSMKLAAVNPTLDVNIEHILSKDFFQSQGTTASSAFGFLPEIGYPGLHPPKHSQAGVHSIVNLTDAFGRVTNAPIGSSSTFKEPTHQMPSNFDGEFHNAIGMPFTLFNDQESNGKP